MNEEQKYVVTDNNDFAIFGKSTNHSDIGKALYGKPTGAGFCTVRQEADSDRVNVHCYGRSISLNMGASERDEELLNSKLNPTY